MAVKAPKHEPKRRKKILRSFKAPHWGMYGGVEVMHQGKRIRRQEKRQYDPSTRQSFGYITINGVHYAI